jgi:hypothetical protein
MRIHGSILYSLYVVERESFSHKLSREMGDEGVVRRRVFILNI